MKQKLVWLLGLFIITGVIVAQVPNTFTAGEMLTATKLNDNFKYLSKVVKDGAGNLLGELAVAIPSEIYVMNKQGYRFGIDITGTITSSGGPTEIALTGSLNSTSCLPNPGPPQTPTPSYGTAPVTTCYFSDSSCFVPLASSTMYAPVMPGGLIYYKGDGMLYYVDKTMITSPTPVYVYEMVNAIMTCNLRFTGNSPAVNNPAVTGVTSPWFTLPITIINE